MSTNAIDTINFLAPSKEIALGSELTSAASTSSSFSSWMDKELGNVNTQLVNADTQLRKLAAGETDNLHQVMVSLEEAKLTFQLAMQVRNHMMEAYQDILRMQI